MDLTRQLGIIPQEKLSYRVVIIGVGAVGSFTALSLAKMGMHNMTIVDPDKIDTHNIPNQFYRKKDVGKYKVEALKEILHEFTDTVPEIGYELQRISPPSGIVISAVDSMKSRQEIWHHIEHNLSVTNYIDSRMGAEIASVYITRPYDQGYESNLWDDSKAVQEPCTARAIIYTSCGLASFICSIVKSILMGKKLGKCWNIDFVNGMITNGLGIKEVISPDCASCVSTSASDYP